MIDEADAIALVADHCDIVARLASTPPAASIRGVYMNSIATVLDQAGKLDEYSRYFGDARCPTFKVFPVREMIIRLAVGGAILEGDPSQLHRGMTEISRRNSLAVSQSLLGRSMLRLLSHDPVRLTEQGIAARRQTCLYGNWSIKERAPGLIVVEYQNEYIWIESALHGAAAGTFEACGVEAELRTELVDRFNGSTTVRFEP